ncbi:MAG: ABC transporter substrate-binding protein [Ramlibacter sp.]
MKLSTVSRTTWQLRLHQVLVLLVLVLGCSAAQAQILIGQTAGFSGPVASGVKETSEGARLYIDHVNRAGGVAGQKIELVSLDDRFEPKQAGENARVLIEEKNVVALFLTRGTPHTEAIIPWLDRHGVPLVGPSTGAMVLHTPLQKHVFNVRSTYQREAEKAVLHLSTIGMQRIAVVHADDSFGRDGLEGANKGFQKAAVAPLAVIKADRSKPVYGPIIQRIVQAHAQAVLWIGSGNAVADGVHKLREAGSAAQVITLSNNASSGFIKSLGVHARGVIVTQVFPSERSVGHPLVAEAVQLLRARGKAELSPAMLEGFAAAKVLVEGLRRAGPKVTREKLLSALERLDFMDLGGLELGYSRTSRTGLNFADLSIIGADGRFRR